MYTSQGRQLTPICENIKPGPYLVNMTPQCHKPFCSQCQHSFHKSTLGCVAALGQPRLVYRSNAKCRLLEFWLEVAKWPWRSRLMNPILNISGENTKMHICANFIILPHIHYKLSYWEAKFSRILSQKGQNDLEGQGQWPPFPIPIESVPWCMFKTDVFR